MSDLTNSSLFSSFFPPKAQVYGGEDFPEGLVITPLDPSDYSELSNQKIVLSGTRMPLEAFTFEGEQRINKTYYAGNDEPIIQVLGDSEKDLNIKGMLADRRYYSGTSGDPNLQNISIGYVNILEALRKSGKPVLLSLKDRYKSASNHFDYHRYGYLIRTKFEVRRISEVLYDLTFSIMTDTKPFTNFFLKQPATQDALNSAMSLAAAASAATAWTTQASISGLDQLINAVKKVINDVAKVVAVVTKAIESINKLVTDITQQVNRILGILDGLLASVSKFKYTLSTAYAAINQIPDKLKRMQAEAVVAVTQSIITKPTKTPLGVNSNTQSMAQYFLEKSNQKSASQTSYPDKSIETISRNLRTQFIGLVKKLQIKTYTCAEGETLAKIAQVQYGDASKWTSLLIYNKLTTTKVVAGQVLQIPSL